MSQTARTTRTPRRRRLRFESHEEVLADVRTLASGPTRHLGHWTLPYICQHLATAIESSIDGEKGFALPLSTRIVARLFRNRILNTRLPTGVKLPPDAEAVLYREPESLEEAVGNLQRACARLQSTSQRQAHPAFGRMTAAQWDLFHLRHAELHLGHIVPESGDSKS